MKCPHCKQELKEVVVITDECWNSSQYRLSEGGEWEHRDQWDTEGNDPQEVYINCGECGQRLPYEMDQELKKLLYV